jgi:hypothetical protein
MGEINLNRDGFAFINIDIKPTHSATMGTVLYNILPEIRIGDWVGYNWPVLTSLSAPFKFLLGTDSMQFFNWNL